MLIIHLKLILKIKKEGDAQSHYLCHYFHLQICSKENI